MENESALDLAKRQIVEKQGLDKPESTTIVTLNLKREKFCQNFCSPSEFFGNGTQSYIDAYGLDINDKSTYGIASSNAYILLKKPEILSRIDELLQHGGLNNSAVDKQLSFLIAQKAELGTSLGAIKEYNKLRGRITDKLKVEGDLSLKFSLSDPVDRETIKQIE